MNVQTPVPVNPRDGAPPPVAKEPRKGAWAGVLTTVVGAVVLVALLVGGIWSGVARGSTAEFDANLTDRASERVSLQLDGGEFDIVFDGTDDRVATLVATGEWGGDGAPVTMRNDGEALVIETSRRISWFGNDDHTFAATLHLPARLEGLVELEADVDVGELTVEGDLARLGGGVDVGDLTVNGAVAEATVDVGVGRASLLGGGGAVTATTDTGELVVAGEFDRVEARTDLGKLTVEGTVRELLTADVAMGSAEITLGPALPGRVELSADLGDIALTLPDEPFQLTAAANIRDAALAQGFTIDAASPEVVITTGLADVTFSMR